MKWQDYESLSKPLEQTVSALMQAGSWDSVRVFFVRCH